MSRIDWKMMLEDDRLSDAVSVATKAHYGQIYHRGEGFDDWKYIRHVINVVASVRQTPFHMTCAFLHDVVEDSEEYSMGDIRELFGEEVATVVDRLTRRHGEDYWDYIERLKRSPVATEIKLADAADHISNIARWDRSEEHVSLLSRYVKVVEILTGRNL